jgi:APA family basic amino acid/polyamine antiporter
MSLLRKKSLEHLLEQAADSDKGLKRTLSAWSLVALGIGAIIGAGLFVRTAAAAGGHAGAAVTLSFIVAAVGCAFAGLCYAEFASMIPIAGSAYTYAYTTMGELVAWIIGWALILEYALGAATVSIAWSEYFNRLLGGAIPYEWTHSPFQKAILSDGILHHGIFNAPALLIVLILTLLLIRGTQQSAWVNAVIVFIKVAIVLIFIVIGWQYIDPANHTPYMIPPDQAPAKLADGSEYSYAPTFNHGFAGVLRGAAIVFFAFIGFDAVSTAAQEAKNPKRDMPIGILGSLVVCTILYILFSYVLTGVAPFTEFMLAGREASVAYAIEHHMPGYHWLATAVTVAILAGFSSVILVMLLGQSRVFYSMSHDGLLPGAFSDLHKKFRTPFKSNWILFLFVGGLATLLPGDITGDLTSIGTLFAFVLVCIGVWIMRVKQPGVPRPFRVPLVPVVSTLGVLVCGAMIISLDKTTQLTAFGWMIIGLVIYFSYSRSRSKHKGPGDILPSAKKFQ